MSKCVHQVLLKAIHKQPKESCTKWAALLDSHQAIKDPRDAFLVPHSRAVMRVQGLDAVKYWPTYAYVLQHLQQSITKKSARFPSRFFVPKIPCGIGASEVETGCVSQQRQHKPKFHTCTEIASKLAPDGVVTRLGLTPILLYTC